MNSTVDSMMKAMGFHRVTKAISLPSQERLIEVFDVIVIPRGNSQPERSTENVISCGKVSHED